MNPIIVKPQNGLFLTDDDIDGAIKEYKINCIVLVHQFGILNNIDLKKYKLNEIKIIEDVAQAWGISNNIYRVGMNSDIVVTSFGKTKPLSYGIGGGLFFNKQDITNIVDCCDNISRENNNILLSYLYPLCEKINIEQLIEIANNIVKEQKNAASKYFEILSNSKDIKSLDIKENNQNIWHRFPIWIEDDKKFRDVLEYLKNTELEYQLPHEIEILELTKFKNCHKITKTTEKKNIILLRTRNIDIEKQTEILKILIKI